MGQGLIALESTLQKLWLSKIDKNSAWKYKIKTFLQVASDVMSLSRESVYLTIASSGEVSYVDEKFLDTQVSLEPTHVII